MSGLRPGERPAHLVGISPTQRAALIAMHGAMDLVPHRGAWAMPGDIKPAVSRATMICLGRRNLIRVNEFGCSARATLTPLGAWYARTLEQQAIDASARRAA